LSLATLASIALALVAALAVAAIIARPSLATGAGGRTLALASIAVLPAVATTFGMNAHLEASKSTRFCLSCHAMEPYGASLEVDDSEHLPANHFQNARVPRDRACYSCHTTYTLYGDAAAKLKGLKHLYVNYLGDIPQTIELYEPFHNRECMHCHDGARTFEENDFHIEYRSELASNETSCLECHDVVHDIENLATLGRWQRRDD